MLKLKLNCESNIKQIHLLARELADAVAVAERTELENQLLSEEQTLATEIYSVVAAKEGLLSRFASFDPSLVLCRGIRVVLNNEGFVLRFRRLLPFSADCQSVDIDSVAPEFKFHLTDLISRNKAFKDMPHIPSMKVINLVKECSTPESLLERVKHISPLCRAVVAKYDLSGLVLQRMLENKEPVL